MRIKPASARKALSTGPGTWEGSAGSDVAYEWKRLTV